MIDATRGKPNTTQVDLANEMLAMPLTDYIAENGADVRNYGGNDGIPEMKRIFAELLRVGDAEVIVGGNSSLNMMFDFVSTMVASGQWNPAEISFICPAPGYDRHFAVCEYFGIKMLTVSMTENGPDMNAVATLAENKAVAGIWCVPTFSNPQGYVYSDETVQALASMKTAHPHFKILWDDAYTIHHFQGERPQTANIMDLCKAAGNAERPVLFTSFSKISTAGSAVACLAAAENSATAAIIRKRISYQTIGPDKINQLRHARYFKNVAGVAAHMQKHAQILRPKFARAIEIFAQELQGTEAAFCTPSGGYFISLETPRGRAARTVELCKQAGVLLTPAGATFPYGKDRNDTNLRFAPSFLTLDEVEQAAQTLCKAIREKS